jgi:thiol-disulfide isomerase/thioredoxin
VTVTRLLLLVVLTAVAVAVALALQRRRPDPPSAPSYRAPAQLDLDDFDVASGRWLVVLFGSTTCDSCPVAWAAVQSLPADGGPGPGRVEFRRIDVQDDPALHRRYRIDGVPTTVVADPDGVVVQAFFGPMTAEELAAALTGAQGSP